MHGRSRLAVAEILSDANGQNPGGQGFPERAIKLSILSEHCLPVSGAGLALSVRVASCRLKKCQCVLATGKRGHYFNFSISEDTDGDRQISRTVPTVSTAETPSTAVLPMSTGTTPVITGTTGPFVLWLSLGRT